MEGIGLFNQEAEEAFDLCHVTWFLWKSFHGKRLKKK
ncbi:hypothetical protein J2S21_004226 [Peribacillus cavernae]|nr:hypothetical protein [Peribacillus cavernae]